jgi:hypothetical protein
MDKHLTHFKRFTKFFIIWVSQNLSIPFWVVGHVHLTLNVYEDWKEYSASCIMHLVVLIGFYIDYKENLNKQT